MIFAVLCQSRLILSAVLVYVCLHSEPGLACAGLGTGLGLVLGLGGAAVSLSAGRRGHGGGGETLKAFRRH